MISPSLQFFMLLAVLLYFLTLVFFIRRKHLNLRYMLLWIFSGVMMLLLALFPEILKAVANLIGIVTPVNALFTIALFCVLIILMSQTAIASRQNSSLLKLAQENALLEERVRELEKKLEQMGEHDAIHKE